VTEGILLREMLYDPLLAKYSVVMIDEVHERTVNTDLLLGLLKKIAKKRRNDMKLVISSATLDSLLWKRYFDFGKKDSDCLLFIIIIIIIDRKSVV
jgi:ATP-dependent RNA helicase DDX35